jgi:hypothetical protein
MRHHRFTDWARKTLGIIPRRRASRPATAPRGHGPLGCRRARFRGGAAPETDLFGHCRAQRRIARRGQWMIRLQSPAGAIIGDFEAVGDPEMAAEHPCAIPALEADDVIGLYRASNRNCRLRRLCRGRATSEIGESSMHFDNESCKLIGRYLVMPHVAPDDRRDLIEINLWRCVFFCQCDCPDLKPAIIRRSRFFNQLNFSGFTQCALG